MKWEDEVLDIFARSGMPTKQRDLTVKEACAIEEACVHELSGNPGKAYNIIVPILADIYGLEANDVWGLPHKQFRSMVEEMTH